MRPSNGGGREAPASGRHGVASFRQVDVTSHRLPPGRAGMQPRLLEGISLPVVVADGALRVTYWNKAAARLLGYEACETMVTLPALSLSGPVFPLRTERRIRWTCSPPSWSVLGMPLWGWI